MKKRKVVRYDAQELVDSFVAIVKFWPTQQKSQLILAVNITLEATLAFHAAGLLLTKIKWTKRSEYNSYIIS